METRKVLTSITDNGAIIFLIVISVLLRLVPHPPNMAPIGALALFSGAHFRGKKMILIPLLTLLISDIFLGFYTEMAFVYGSYFLILLIGTLLRNHQKAPYIVGASLLSSILFFSITNFGVWAMGSWYAKDIMGLLNAYVLAIPFFKNTLIGDMVFTLLFFYGYRYIFLYIANKNVVSSKHIKVSR